MPTENKKKYYPPEDRWIDNSGQQGIQDGSIPGKPYVSLLAREDLGLRAKTFALSDPAKVEN